MTRALVTGGSGFVGANLVRRLIHVGCEVHVLLRRDHRPWRLEGLSPLVIRHDGDVADRSSVEGAVASSRPDWIFHLAAYGAYPQQTGIATMIETNVRGTANVVEVGLAASVASIILAGSSSEYGLKDHAPREGEPLNPDSDYAVTKAAATMFGLKESRRSGAKVTTLRLYSAYGPWEEPTRLWPTLLTHAIDGALPRLAAPGTARDFVYVGDIVDAFVKAAEAPQSVGPLYNIASGTQTTLADLVELFREHFAIASEPEWGSMDGRAWDTGIWVGDAARARDDLDWSAKTSVAQGLRLFQSWMSTDPAMLDFYRARIHR